MVKKLDELREKISTAANQVRERIFALFCLTVIAMLAMYKLTDPENIIINVIVGICSFVGGVASERMRKGDPPKDS